MLSTYEQYLYLENATALPDILIDVILVVVSFGIAYLWVGPLYFNAKAVLYQDLFCTKRAVEDQNNTDDKQGLFDA